MSQPNVKSMKSLHKIRRQSAGSLHLEWKYCGRENCRCAKGGALHGPYGAVFVTAMQRVSTRFVVRRA